MKPIPNFFLDNKIEEPQYEIHQKSINLFLTENDKYLTYLTEVKNIKRRRVLIDLNEIEEFFQNSDLCFMIEQNTERFIEMFTRCCDEILEDIEKDPSVEVHDVISHYEEKKRNIDSMMSIDDGESEATNEKIPDGLCRRFYINFKAREKMTKTKMREIRSKHLGKLVKTQGIVSRTTDVRNEIAFACFLCDKCPYEIYIKVTGTQFTPPDVQCPCCKKTKKNGCLYLYDRGSRFERYQELYVTEIPEETPVGSVPRKVKIIVRGSLTRKCSTGDEILLTGVYSKPQVMPFSGEKKKSPHIELHDLIMMKKKYNTLLNDFDLMKEIEDFRKSGSTSEIYDKMAKSIAPELHGLLDIKKALLLQLVGGSTKKLNSGVKLRGDLNIVMVGDPGVGKSQLLKYISRIAPRGVYTTGKGSSAVGLTAAVIKDRSTGEYILEGGALVLSDMGVCCIDEFDKMNDHDLTALHEAMEQQSISIAKAGITTTLNSRSSILAAANPQWGSYNRKKSVTDNIDIPAALLSRFDLIFLLLDKNTNEYNKELARHILSVHRYGGIKKEEEITYLPQKFIKAYVAKAKTYNPRITKELKPFIVDVYSNMRQNHGNDEIYGSTPRTLLSILRLSQALAKLRFSNVVIGEDVREAKRLMDSCKAMLMENYDTTRGNSLSSTDLVFTTIQNVYHQNDNQKIVLSDLLTRFNVMGISKEEVLTAINMYSNLGVLTFDEETEIIYVNEV